MKFKRTHVGVERIVVYVWIDAANASSCLESSST